MSINWRKHLGQPPKKAKYRFFVPLNFLIFYQVMLTFMFFIFRMKYLYFLISVGMIFQLSFDMIFFTIFVIIPINIFINQKVKFSNFWYREQGSLLKGCIITFSVFVWFPFVIILSLFFLLFILCSSPHDSMYLIIIFILYILANLITMLVINSNAKKNKKILLLFLVILMDGLGMKCFESTYDILEIPIKKGENLSVGELYSRVDDKTSLNMIPISDEGLWDASVLKYVNTDKKGKYPIFYIPTGKRGHILAVYKVE